MDKEPKEDALSGFRAMVIIPRLFDLGVNSLSCAANWRRFRVQREGPGKPVMVGSLGFSIHSIA
jgi:hypothetical protein